MQNYISNLRSKIGKNKFIHPAARIVVENDKGEILFVERLDNGLLGLPAGGLEENETIEQCIIREVKEETGLDILDLEVIGISSNPKNETVQYPNGDVIQYFTIEFYSNSWSGELTVLDKKEIKKAVFKDKSFANQLPINERSIFETLDYYRKVGKIRIR